MAFANDILSKDTSLYPVVIIDKDGDPIYISTNSTTIDGIYYKPILLNVPSLKESIDLEKRNYTISSVTLNLSNFEQDGVRFSELVGNRSLVNRTVDMYWISPSVATIADAKHIYSGWVLRYDHDDEKVKLSVEDRSQSVFHIDLPQTLPIQDKTVPEGNHGKAIPMVYGIVDNSPCIVQKKITAESDMEIAVDRDDSGTGIAGVEVYAKVDTFLVPLAQEIDGSVNLNSAGESGTVYNSGLGEIFYKSFNKIVFNRIDEEDGYPIESNEMVCREIIGIKDMEFEPLQKLSHYWTWVDDGGQGWCYYTTLGKYLDHSDNPVIYGTLVSDAPQTDHPTWDGTSNLDGTVELDGEWGIGDMDDIPADDLAHGVSTSDQNMAIPGCIVHTGAITGDFIDEHTLLKYAYIIRLANFNHLGIGGANDGVEGVVRIGSIGSTKNIHEWTINPGTDVDGNPKMSQSSWERPEPGAYGDLGAGASNAESKVIDRADKLLIYVKIDHTSPFLTLGSGAGHLTFTKSGEIGEGLEVRHHLLLNDAITRDYFAYAVGRIHFPTAVDIIQDIMQTEFDPPLDSNDLEDSDHSEYSDWIYAFAQNEKINSKKLLEQLASISPYIPRFNNLGEFNFNVIRKIYSEETILTSVLIKKADCISYSNSRTKIEDVRTTCTIHYDWSYPFEEFDKKVESTMDILPDYELDYYGLESDVELLVDDERGKMIRHMSYEDINPTASNIAKWLLLLNCNQHLKMKVKLPLNYLDIEVGSLVRFDEELGDALPYGINYAFGTGNYSASTFTIDGTEYLGSQVNGQQVFPVFMVTSTNKTLQYVEVECIQMHNLDQDNPLVPTGAIEGVMDNQAWNYNPNANVDSGIVVDATTYTYEGCPYNYLGFTGAGEANIIDYCTNPINEPFTEGSEPPHVFVNPEDIERGSEVHAYWETWVADETLPEPEIYYTANCEWADTIKHELLSITAYRVLEDGTEAQIGQMNVANGETVMHIDTSQSVFIWISPDAIDVFSKHIKFKFQFASSPIPAFYNDNNLRIKKHNTIIYNAPIDVTTENTIETDIVSITFDPAEEPTDAEDFDLWINITIPSIEVSGSSYSEVSKLYDIVFAPPLPPTTTRGDLNSDGVWNVLDIVTLSNHVLYETWDDEAWNANSGIGYASDVNGDGNWNILDVVNLVNCVLSETCDIDLED